MKIPIIILLTSCALALGETNVSKEIRNCIDSGQRRPQSGRGVFLHSLRKHPLTLASVTEQLKAMGLDLSADGIRNLSALMEGLFSATFQGAEQTNEFRLENVAFKGKKFIRRTVELSEPELEAIRSDYNSYTNFSLVTYVYNGRNTIRIEAKRFNGARFTSLVIEPDAIYVPEFWTFGRDLDMQRWLQDASEGDIEMQVLERSGRLTFIIDEPPQQGLEKAFRRHGEITVVPARDCMPERVTLGYGGWTQVEWVYTNYVSTETGIWFPGLTVRREYAPVSDSGILTIEERFELIPDTLEFNVPVEDELFSPELPPGTRGVDFSKTPPQDFVVTADGIEHLP